MPSFEETYIPKQIPSPEALLSFGFVLEDGAFLYSTQVLDGAFLLRVRIQDKDVETSLLETETGEPYELYRIDNAHGEYVGAVREAVKDVLLDIKRRCYPTSWTMREQPSKILAYLKETYNEEPDYPWQDEFGVLRRKDNQKWYALFMPLPVSKVGIQEERNEVIMNIRHDGQAVDHRIFYPAYHMTKKTWVSMVLDGSVPLEEILGFIEESRELAKGGKKSK